MEDGLLYLLWLSVCGSLCIFEFREWDIPNGQFLKVIQRYSEAMAGLNVLFQLGMQVVYVFLEAECIYCPTLGFWHELPEILFQN